MWEYKGREYEVKCECNSEWNGDQENFDYLTSQRNGVKGAPENAEDRYCQHCGYFRWIEVPLDCL